MDNAEKQVRVRFAPSPTGSLHVGGVRTALYNFLFAKKNGGDFILRLEDTDQKRFVEGSAEGLIKSLDYLNLISDEGVFQSVAVKDDSTQVVSSEKYPGLLEVGNFGPYIQSERLELYKKYANQLVTDGKAYYCFCEPERLEKSRKKQQEEKQAPMYDRYCLNNLSEQQINEKLKTSCPATIRLKVPKDEVIEFEDVIRGKVSFNSNTIDDQVLLKSDGFPTYHLANVVDDHLMNITHVLRAEEWLPSTPKHILLYRAFGWEMPKFAHLPQLLSTDKKKLSKRMGDVAVEDYIKKGYLKEAIINFVALLGWNEGGGSTQEIFSMEELVEKFDLSHVHKAGAVFDVKKLDWINAQYIKKLSIDELYEKALPFFEEKEFYKAWNVEREAWSNEQKKEFLKKVLRIEQERLSKFSDVGQENRFFFEDAQPEKELIRWKNISDEELLVSLKKSFETLENIPEIDWTLENLEAKLLEAAGDKRGDLLWPLRASLTGVQKSPSPFEVAWTLGKTESLKRLKNALEIVTGK